MLNNAPCMRCGTDDKWARMRGCDGLPASSPVEIEVYEGRKIIYWHCPKNFIPASIHQWHSIYRFYKDFPSANMGSITEQKKIFLDCYNVYEKHLAEFNDELAQKIKNAKRK